MLLSERMEDFCRMDKTTTEDGFGGVNIVWQEGAHFRAIATQLQATELEIAYQTGQKRLYAIYCKPIVGLVQHDRVKRLSDGVVFRVTATPDPQQTSAASAIGLSRTTMEVIDA